MLRQRNERGTGEREDTKTLQGDHHVARPAIECMDEHDHFPWIGLGIIEEPLKLGALGDLLPTCASLARLKKDRLRGPTEFCRLSDGPLLSIGALRGFLRASSTLHRI